MKKKSFFSVRVWSLLFLLVGFVIFINCPTPEGLTVQGHRSLAVFILCLTLWVFQVLPLPVTSLFIVVLLPAVNIVDSKQAYSLFGNQAVFFILGALILAAAMFESGLSQRISVRILRLTGSNPKNLLFGVMATGYFLSYWMPEHAVCAFMFPIILEIVRSLRLFPGKSNYSQAIFLALSWGVIIGGVSTFLGGARNILAVAILQQTSGLNIGFFEWMKAIAPLTLILLFISFRLLIFFFPIDIDNIDAAIKTLESKINQMGPLSKNEKIVASILFFTVLAWIFLGHRLGLANISIVAVVILFLFKAVTWEAVEENVNWGIILIYGGAVCIGYAMSQTHAALWVAEESILKFIPPGFGLLAGFSLLSWVISEGVSNSVVVAMILPVAIDVATTYHLNPVVMSMAVALPAGFAFSLPMGTPANAIVYSSGYIRLKDMVKTGIILNLIAWILCLFMMKFYWPLIGLEL